MWLPGAMIGLLLGSLSSGDSLWLVGAILGGTLGQLLAQKARLAQLDQALARLKLVENELASLQQRIAQPDAAPLAQPLPPENRQIAPASAPPEIVEPSSPARPRAAPPPPSAKPATKDLETAFEHWPAQLPDWLSSLWSGNPLAKIGIVLLFFGVASGLKLAVEYGLMPLWLRLFAAACGGVAMVVFGYSRIRQPAHRAFGQALQGGGCALLYLVVYFMLGRYAMIGQMPAFLLFAAIGVTCVLLAARQDAPYLAVFGISGAFLAPVLAGGQAPTPLPLFLYFTLLNVFILTIDWFRSWRILNLAGFIFTLLVGSAWAVDHYRNSHYLITQAFVALYLLAYSAMPAATALLRAPGRLAWQEGMLLFGPPLAGAFLQHALLGNTRYGEAWSALGGALWYAALWLALFRRPEPEIRLIERSHLGIALALLTLAVPLAFGAQVTSAFWALEGSAVVWFGARQQRWLAQAIGCAMIFIAGIALLCGWPELDHRYPIFNDIVLGGFVITVGSLFAAHQLRRHAHAQAIFPLLPFIWGMTWWFGVGLNEIEHFLPADLHAGGGLAYSAVTVLLLEVIAVVWQWPQLRMSAVLLVPALWISVILSVDRSSHPLAGGMLVALPFALLVHERLLKRHADQTREFLLVRSLGAWWLVLLALGGELAWQAGEYLAQPLLWQNLAWTLSLTLGVILPCLEAHLPAVASRLVAAAYRDIAVPPALLLLSLLLVWANFNLDGDLAALPYLPLLSIFDLGQLAAFAAIHHYAGPLPENLRTQLQRGLAGLGLLWVSAMPARLVHAWADVPFTAHALLHSMLFQAALTLIWTITAIATMIHASRRHLRPLWYAGFALLGVVAAKLLLIDAQDHGTLTWTLTLIGVALLVLAASYFAPRPPAAEEGDQSIAAPQ